MVMHGQLEILADRPQLRHVHFSTTTAYRLIIIITIIIITIIITTTTNFFSHRQQSKKELITTLPCSPTLLYKFRRRVTVEYGNTTTTIIFQGANIQPVQLSTCPVLLPFYLPPQIGTL